MSLPWDIPSQQGTEILTASPDYYLLPPLTINQQTLSLWIEIPILIIISFICHSSTHVASNLRLRLHLGHYPPSNQNPKASTIFKLR